MTATTSQPTADRAALQTGIAAFVRRNATGVGIVAIVALWVIVWAVSKGSHTLVISDSERTDVHQWFLARSNDIETAATNNSSLVLNLLGHLSDGLESIIVWLQHLFTEGEFPRQFPQVGWAGILPLAMLAAYAAAGTVSSLLVGAALFVCGMLGLWVESIDTLIVVLFAVLISVIVGIPLGTWMAHNRYATAIITPVLDVMQTLPSLVYLLPFVLIFGISTSCAVLVTIVYALPPVIRITAHGLRNVSRAKKA